MVSAFLLVICSPAAWAAPPAPLTTLSAIHSLSNAEASKAVPVAFEATVTYYRASNRDLFMQDGDAAIFVHVPASLKLVPGDRVRVRGTTHPSFRPYIESSDITVLRHEKLPRPVQASFDEMIRGEDDCKLARVTGLVRSADICIDMLSVDDHL